MKFYRRDFTFESDSTGFMLYYKNEQIGGVTTGRTRGNKLRGSAGRKEKEIYTSRAKAEIAAIVHGWGQKQYLDAIDRINTKHKEARDIVRRRKKLMQSRFDH